jgi:hypothetical protein
MVEKTVIPFDPWRHLPAARHENDDDPLQPPLDWTDLKLETRAAVWSSVVEVLAANPERDVIWAAHRVLEGLRLRYDKNVELDLFSHLRLAPLQLILRVVRKVVRAGSALQLVDAQINALTAERERLARVVGEGAVR